MKGPPWFQRHHRPGRRRPAAGAARDPRPAPLSYRFRTHFHPYVSELVDRLVRARSPGCRPPTPRPSRGRRRVVTLPDGRPAAGALRGADDRGQLRPHRRWSASRTRSRTSTSAPAAAYAVYNWELFFHVPLTIAMHLSKNRRFAEAQRWFHYIFDPTDDSDGPTPRALLEGQAVPAAPRSSRSRRCWSTSPPGPIRQLLTQTPSQHRGVEGRAVPAARRRPVPARGVHVQDGDGLPGQPDRLGRRAVPAGHRRERSTRRRSSTCWPPTSSARGRRRCPRKGWQRPQTYDEPARRPRRVRQRAARASRPTSRSTSRRHPTEAADDAQLGDAAQPRRGALLLRAAQRQAAGLLGHRRRPAVQDPQQPEPPGRLPAAAAVRAADRPGDAGPRGRGRARRRRDRQRAQPAAAAGALPGAGRAKAAEICQEVKSLGSAAALGDGEGGRRGARPSCAPGTSARSWSWPRSVRYQAVAGGGQGHARRWRRRWPTPSRATRYYERQLGPQGRARSPLPELDELDTTRWRGCSFAAAGAGGGRAPGRRRIIADDRRRGRRAPAQPARRRRAGQAGAAQRQQEQRRPASSRSRSVLAHHPDVRRRTSSRSASAARSSFGGSNLAAHFIAAGRALDRCDARPTLPYEAGQSARIGGYARREQDWAFQSNLAAGEINQIFKQLRAAQIREAIAEREWHNHQQQIKHAQEIETLPHRRTQRQDHQQALLRLDGASARPVRAVLPARLRHRPEGRARAAARARRPEPQFLQYGYLAGQEGLLAGERLYLDVKRMELAYHELNRREYELTKHVSLLQVDPLALIELRDHRARARCAARGAVRHGRPGHYFRRLRSVAVSIPCVAGPYAAVNCTLTLLSSTIRTSPVGGRRVRPRRARTPTASATTTAACSPSSPAPRTNDSGLFETNLRDERYLPFEAPARSASGGSSCPPTYRSSTTTRSPTSSCTCATRRARAAQALRHGGDRGAEGEDRGGRDGRLGPAAVGAPRVPHRWARVRGHPAGGAAGAHPAAAHAAGGAHIRSGHGGGDLTLHGSSCSPAGPDNAGDCDGVRRRGRGHRRCPDRRSHPGRPAGRCVVRAAPASGWRVGPLPRRHFHGRSLASSHVGRCLGLSNPSRGQR